MGPVPRLRGVSNGIRGSSLSFHPRLCFVHSRLDCLDCVSPLHSRWAYHLAGVLAMNDDKRNLGVVCLYRKLRASGIGGIVGQDAQSCLNGARTLYRWSCLEEDYVRIRVVPDDSVTLDDIFPDVGRMSPESIRRYVQIIEDRGVFGVVGEFRCPGCQTWNSADSIWACAGYLNVSSPYENPYVLDIMSATLEAFDKARLCAFPDCLEVRELESVFCPVHLPLFRELCASDRAQSHEGS